MSGLNAIRAVDTDHKFVQDHVIATNDSAEDQAMMSETARLTAVPVTLSLSLSLSLPPLHVTVEGGFK